MEEFIKHIEHAKVHNLADIVDYEKGKVASLTLCQQKEVGVTLFAIDQGEGLNTHSAPGDAMAYILDGQVKITIGGEPSVLETGQMVVMPAGVPHALEAVKPFKMLLVVIKKIKES
ncbi:MAG: cupin [Acidobacteria bacterium]|nr:MAG: cupin [Acidobacteriota bacterium]